MDSRLLAAVASGLSGASIIVFFVWSFIKKSSLRLPLPPGPKPLPIIGNVLDIPNEKQWLAHHQWAQRYGDVVHLQVLGQHVVVLNSAKATNDLFERRGTIYSSRPASVMINKLMGFEEWNFAVLTNGETWRKERRMFHSQFQPNVVAKFRSGQMRQARIFLKQLAADPNDLPVKVRGVVGATIMDVVYGVQVDSTHRYISLAERVVQLFSDACLPGASYVDLLPVLRYVPSWFPGATFHQIAALTRRVSEEMLEEPLQEVERGMVSGTGTGSLTSELLEESYAKGASKDQRRVIKGVAGVAYAGGSDTTISTLLSFFLAMANYPDIQAKAQAELKAVVGLDRLPEFSDCDNLPYINAIILELLRWQPVLPLGLPHSTTADDEYNGYLIPKGTVVFGNIWSILHDPQEYPEPEEFRPERFLNMTEDGLYVPNKEVRDPRIASFGFGRRVCPGRHLAEQSLYAVIASVLSVFSITAPQDENGKSVPCKVEMQSGVASHPALFECNIAPRSQRAAELIDQPPPERGLWA